MIKLVVCDLDNTLYDWVGSFVPAFDAMLGELVAASGVSETQLLDSFQRVHQQHGTSEYALAVAELDVLNNDGLTTQERLGRYGPALDAFRSARRANLMAYPDVLQTLQQLKQDGRTLVAHSDAMVSYAVARLCHLRLLDLFDGLWAIADHPLPAGVSQAELAHRTGHETRIPGFRWGRELDPDERKPALHVLEEILRCTGASAAEAVYVGDSLIRDVLLAQRAGVADVFAAYGRRTDDDHYQRLIEISHWTPSQVIDERRLAAQNVQPTTSIEGFGEILTVVQNLDRRSGIGNRAREYLNPA